MKNIDFLAELNEAQQQAVLYTNGPSLVIAGAGSGKTRVLTYRIAMLLHQGVSPYSILALTFTNKAAREMRERISQLVGEELATPIWMGTFHSRFASILRMEAGQLGFPSSFTIYDTVDSKNLVKQIIRDLQLSDQIYKPGEVLSRISAAKNNLLLPEAYLADSAIQTRDKKAMKPQLGEIYRIYTTRCFLAGAMDFDDLLLKTNVLFRDFPETLQKYQQKFSHILVDEYQDTNFSQYLIVKKLAARHKNLCVVGDDAQSIYAFRGAKIENIFNFKTDYPDFKLFKLEQNYRSTQMIVNAANSLIEKNKNQIRKEVFSEKEAGRKIRILRTATDLEEGYEVASSIREIYLREHCPFSDFSILYRTNAQSRIFEDHLRKNNIPYRIFGGISFYQRKEVKDLLAYFRLVVNPSDDLALERVINYPKRGIGDTTLEKLRNRALELQCVLWDVMTQPGFFPQGIDRSTYQRILEFATMILKYQELSKQMTAFDLAHQIATETGILKELHNDQTPEGVSRFENIEELLNSVREFERTAEQDQEKDLAGFLQLVTLATDADQEDNDRNKVSLMTVHSAKGLEFRHVFIVGMEEELFPSSMSSGSLEELEEERRLFYVALTRAMESATLSYCGTRQRWGKFVEASRSRFIREIDPQFLELPPEKELPEIPGDYGSSWKASPKGFRPPKGGSGDLFSAPMDTSRRTQPTAGSPKPADPPKNMQTLGRRKQEEEKERTDSAPPVPDQASGLKAGDKVFHDRFGDGLILSLEGSFPNVKARVRFDSGGDKTLLLRFARLEKRP